MAFIPLHQGATNVTVGDGKGEMEVGEFLLQEKGKGKSNSARASQKPTVLLGKNSLED